MAVISEKDEIRKYKYYVTRISLKIPSVGVVNIDKSRLTAMSIIEDYENLVFPMFSITLGLDKSTYYNILKNKNTSKVYLRIDKFYTDINNANRSSYRKFIDGNFNLIMDEDTKNLQSSSDVIDTNTKASDLERDDSENLFQSTESVKFYLYSDTVDKTKKNINKVFTKCTVSDVMTYLFTEANIKNVLMAQPDNLKKYDEMLIPPLSILKAIKHLDYYYGLYKKGSMIFFGLNYTYVIPYSGDCKVYPKNSNGKVTNIIIPKSTRTSSSLGNVYKNNNDTVDYIVSHTSSASIVNESISHDYLSGNSIKVIDSYNDEDKTSKSKAISRTNVIRYFHNTTENEYLGETYIAQTNALSTVIDLRFENVDIETLLPYRKINMVFEDSKYTKEYNSKYIITSVVYNFEKSGDDELLLNAQATFKSGK